MWVRTQPWQPGHVPTAMKYNTIAAKSYLFHLIIQCLGILKNIKLLVFLWHFLTHVGCGLFLTPLYSDHHHFSGTLTLAQKLPLLRNNAYFQPAFYRKVLQSGLMGHKIHHSQLYLKVNSTYAFRKAFSVLFFCCGCLSSVGGMFAAWWVDIVVMRRGSDTSCTSCTRAMTCEDPPQKEYLLQVVPLLWNKNALFPVSAAMRSPVTFWHWDPTVPNQAQVTVAFRGD